VSISKTYIDNLLVHVVQPDGKWLWLPVIESPYFITLDTRERKPFDEYHTILKRESPESFRSEMSYDEFIFMANNFNADRVFVDNITTEDGIRVLDGQHRLSVLRYMFGSGVTIEQANNTVIKINLPAIWAISKK
jgi:hypothetical protein